MGNKPIKKCSICGAKKNEPVYTLEGVEYCACCLIHRLADKGTLQVHSDENGDYEVIL